MLIRYQYRIIQGKNLGWFQSDEEDFKKLWKNKTFRENLMWCKVDTGDKNYFHMWSNRWVKIPKQEIKMENPF